MTDCKKNLKNLMISTYDVRGGAARSAYRLHHAFLKKGIDSKMVVQFKDTDDDTVSEPPNTWSRLLAKVRTRLDLRPLATYKGYNHTPWSLGWLPSNLSPTIESINPEVVHLNWIGGGFMSIKEIFKIRHPVVWTFHDMWAFTGGCHYSFDCRNYEKSCGSCPQLGSNKELDISKRVWLKKKKYWKNLNLAIVCPSRWLAECVKKSSLFKHTRVEVIPYVIDLGVFKPIDKQVAREILNLPSQKKIVLFGSLSALQDKRKGFQYLLPALKELYREGFLKQVEMVVFGSSRPKQPQDIDFNINYLGVMNDDVTLSLVYSAADVFVAPSIQDNLPNTVIESLACGTPVVAFNIGGNPDMITHKQNGYMVQPFDIQDLKQGIMFILNNSQPEFFLENARRVALQKFNPDSVAEHYMDLFCHLTRKNG